MKLELWNKQFGRLTCLFPLDERDKSRVVIWWCKCNCGNEKKISTKSLKSLKSLKSPKPGSGSDSRSCGCFRNERARELKLKHGPSKTTEYFILRGILNRCSNINHKSYKNYGARGISYDPRYNGQNGIHNFIDDMGMRPSKKYSIDRIDGSKGYYKENMRWATHKEQQRNRRNNKLLKYKGQEKPACIWAEEYNIDNILLYARLRRGWSIEKALTKPKGKWKQKI